MTASADAASNDERRPSIERVLETVLYFTDEGRAERFYRDVLGMRPIGKQEGRHLFFRAGESVFLLFNADATNRPDDPLAHGATGPGHVCFTVSSDDYAVWKRHLAAHDVTIVGETAWDAGSGGDAKSFYFRDSEGNLLEIANRDLWPP